MLATPSLPLQLLCHEFSEAPGGAIEIPRATEGIGSLAHPVSAADGSRRPYRRGETPMTFLKAVLNATAAEHTRGGNAYPPNVRMSCRC